MSDDIIEDATSSKTEVTTTDQDEKNIALITWITTIFFGFIPGLIFYLVKKDSAYIQDQAKEALNWSITALFAYIGAIILTVIIIGAFLIPIIGVVHLIFCIMGAVATSKGDAFRVPFALRLIK
ncbi:DUF4870 domain-containing protein [Marinimicrobium locisalis]|uniref:DUF4870 domain-containing protein n=1 Tax=Marinimicrobium locisalis TaxID=546022 RepID=UPI0032216FF4